MSNHKQSYKIKPVGFVSTNAGRLVRTIKLEERRRLQRNENYAKHRDVPENQENDENSSAAASREIRFQRWKAERDIKKRIESQNKKPVFKVGVVHHKFYSPIHEKGSTKSVPCHGRGVRKQKHEPTPPKRITRATQKRLEAKMAGTSSTPGVASISGFRVTQMRREAKMASNTLKSAASPSGSELNYPKSRRKSKFPSTPKKFGASFAPANYSFKAPEGLAEIPLFGKFVIPKNGNNDEIDCENKKEAEKPWPHASHPPVDIMASQEIRNSLARKCAQDKFRSDSIDTENSDNSSIEAINLRLSSDDEGPGEIEQTEKAEVNNSAREIIAETQNIEEIITLQYSTPPRSGSPAPASFSPYIVSSRGKNSARKEQQIKMGIRRSLSGNNIPTKDTVMQNLNISVEEEEQTAQYFKFILESTIDSLKEMCKKWEEIMEEVDLSEDAKYQINQAIGQTNLLMRKKFERFRGLVLDCETGKGEMLVTCKDLQGFWDVINIEVENCNSRFSKLDNLRSKNWIEEQISVPLKRVTKKKNVATKPKVAGKSSARSWILAARKKMTQPEDSGEVNVVSCEENDAKKSVKTPLKDGNSRRSLGASSTSVSLNRRRSSTIATPRKTPIKTPGSLRKIVQLSQATKAIRSPLAIIKISKMCKTPEVELDNTISYVNSDQTPAKGILKKSENSESSESVPPKSTRKVDFNDDVFLDEVPVENEVSEELQNSLDLGRALAKIDSYDDGSEDDFPQTDFMKNVTMRKIEKRLDFEDESFIETENTDTGEAIVAVTPETPELVAEIPEPAAQYADLPQIPAVRVVPATPIHGPSKNTRASLNWSEIYDIPIEEEVPEEAPISAKVLRNRTIPASTPNKSNRRSIKSPAKDKQSHDSPTKENCDPLREKKFDSKHSNTRSMMKEKETTEQPLKPRRSTRKSIKLGADECTACTPKPTTPHSVRSRKVSVAARNSRKSVGGEIIGDLISFDSPI